MNRRTVLGFGAAVLTAMAAKGEVTKPDGSLPTDPTEIIPLWPATPPGGNGVALTAEIVERALPTDDFHDRYVHKVGKPLLTVFRPDAPDGSAVLLCPGGGYIRTVIDKEAWESARAFNAAGITVFVLRYRLPGEGWVDAADVPLQDAQRAMRLIRSKAAQYGLDPARLGVLGFSAGGHVAASLATRYGDKVYDPVDTADGFDPRPAFAGLMYPVITMNGSTHPGSRHRLLGDDTSPERIAKYSCDLHAAAAPPSFIAYSLDDKTVPPVSNGLAMYQALVAANVPVELHAFGEGGHGYGIRLAAGMPCAAWPGLFLRWGARGGWFKSVSF